MLSLQSLDLLWRLLNTRRGVHLRAWWKTAEIIHGSARMRWNDHALFMPPQAWQALQRKVGAVLRLDRSVANLLGPGGSGPANFAIAVDQEIVLLDELLRRGARLTAAAAAALEQRGRYAGFAADTVSEFLRLDREARAANGRSCYRRPFDLGTGIIS